MPDGQLQRQALTAAERSLEALGRGEPGAARTAVAQAVERDQVGAYVGLADAVDVAASELESGNKISESTWNMLADAVGPGPLAALVDQFRSGI